ncbi:CoA transferase [Sphingosinicella sp. LHD-64]|uniref:CaiB/BaiF CoA transferase family protein n=1 Tax=Sphingosinicella sp. LHD-64 TaxID=3072139 RepID=UPI00280C78D0|nr:CoA transferase [Sphingosinicella sp. LHD-64]MDQ8757584.1 CoA transferase [Sphingosinicella sp. LHD-64]
MSGGPYRSLRVLDLSRVLAGPWAAQMLGDMGADVIKVERPGVGDDSRLFGPPFFKDNDGRDTTRSAMFQSANRNKRAITLNIAESRGQALLKKLVATADVLIENYKVGTLARYGLGYEDLQAINPGLIYCSITGYGQTGPYRDRGGYDPIVQAASGMMSVTGFPESEPGGGPMKAGPSIVDMTAGNYAVVAIQAALYDRATNGGAGQFIDIALLDVGVALAGQFGLHYLASGQIPGLVGTQANGGAPGGGFRCADGYIMIAPGSQALYESFCRALGRSELATDPRFLTNSLRLQHRPELMRLLDETIGGLPVAEVHRRMVEAGIPSNPVNNMAQVFDDPQVRERGMRVSAGHSTTGELPLIANPIKASGPLLVAYRAPPDVGQDTRAILSGELGLSDAELDELRRDGIV